MKLSCWIDLAVGENLAQRARFLAQAGFEAFEIFLTPADLRQRKRELQEIIRNESIAISAIGPIQRGWLIDPSPAQRGAAQAEIAETLQIAAEIGRTPVIILPILGYSRALPQGATTGRTFEGDTAILVEALASLAERARQAGSTLLLELINRYESPVANRVSEGVRIMQAVQNDHCRLALDLFHMNFEEPDLQAGILAAFPYLGHLHLADSNRRRPGLGHTDFRALFGVLARAGYDRYLTLETVSDPSQTAQSLPQTARYLHSLIQIAKTQARELSAA